MENRKEALLLRHDHLVYEGKSGPKIVQFYVSDALELTIKTPYPLLSKRLVKNAGFKLVFRINFQNELGQNDLEEGSAR